MGGVEDEIVECFHKGGGVPYERFPRFHAVMAEDSGQSVLSSLDAHVLPLVPGLSITDPCLGLEDTASLLFPLARLEETVPAS